MLAAALAAGVVTTAHAAASGTPPSARRARSSQIVTAAAKAHRRRARRNARCHRRRRCHRHRHHGHQAAHSSGLHPTAPVLTAPATPAVAAPAPPGPPAFTWLHTNEEQILNADNQPVRLTGFDEPGTYEGSAGAAPDACGWTWRPPLHSLGADVSGWGFNAVKVTLSWSALEPTPPTVVNGQLVHHWDAAYLQMVDAEVADLAAHHVYAILALTQAALSPAFKRYDGQTCEGSGMPAWLFPNAPQEDYSDGWCDFWGNQQPAGVPERPIDGFVAAWQALASRYATNPAVAAADLLNEPGTALMCAWRHISKPAPSYLDDFNSRVGSAIRAVDPNVLLVMEDENESEGPDGHFMSSTAGLTNVVFEWHNYASSWSGGQPPLADELAFARRIHAPLLLGEFDAFNADDNGAPPADPNWQADLTAMMSYLKQNDVSWLMENYEGRWSIRDPTTGLGKQPLLSVLQGGLGEPASVPSVADPGDIGSTPGSAWSILLGSETW